MNCPEAYRAALIREFSPAASPAPAPVPGQRQAAGTGDQESRDPAPTDGVADGHR